MLLFYMKSVKKDIREIANGAMFYSGELNNNIDVRLLRSLSNAILRTRLDGEETLYFSGKLIGNEFGKNIKTSYFDDIIAS